MPSNCWIKFAARSRLPLAPTAAAISMETILELWMFLLNRFI
jgi:hypothetical protein